jgi:ABC-type branched-subunit amino acid transport system ATPase component
VLEVRELRSGYGRIPILDGVSLRVDEAEILGILGHNGMGKTTLLKTLVGELPVTGGEIRFVGREVSRLSMASRARLGFGYVPQGQGVFPQLTVMENLRMGAMRAREDGGMAEVLVHFPILKPLLDRPARTLSGGQRQILSVARCLLGRPQLMLLDEPSEGIQPSIVEEIVAKLQELTRAWRLTVVLVEQDLQVITALARRVLIMQKGKVTAELPPARLRDPKIVEEYLGL